MSAHTPHDTQSCYPCLQYLPQFPPTFPANLVSRDLRHPPGTEKLYFDTPSSLPAIKTNQSSTNVQHKKVIEQMLDLVKTSFVEDSRVRFKGLRTAGQSSSSAQEADISGRGTAMRGQGCRRHSFTSTKPGVIRGPAIERCNFRQEKSCLKGGWAVEYIRPIVMHT
jgi:hypothetical protein